jgi:hypothetical protein
MMHAIFYEAVGEIIEFHTCLPSCVQEETRSGKNGKLLVMRLCLGILGAVGLACSESVCKRHIATSPVHSPAFFHLHSVLCGAENGTHATPTIRH